MMMKKIDMKHGIYLVALATLVLISACRDDDVLNDGVESRGVVKTEFMISFPAKVAGNTRMTADIVQADGLPASFRGIQDIKLYPFNAKVNGITTSTDIPTAITLVGTGAAEPTTTGPSGVANNTIAASGALFTGNSSHLYQDIEVPIGTKAFMFYGMGGLTIPTTPADYFEKGIMNDNFSTATTLGAIIFSPKQITDETPGADGTYSKAIAEYLTAIANAHYNDGTDHPWSASNNVFLKTLYNNFITMHAGSWTSVKGAVQQLYSTIHSKTFTTPADISMKSAILTAIKADDNVSDSNNDGVLEFLEGNNDTYEGYPANINLPDGAAFINWTGSAFVACNFTGYDGGTVLAQDTPLDGYYTENAGVYTACAANTVADGTSTYYKKLSSDNTGLDIPNLSKYAYPAPLYYRVLSDIRTALVSKADYYTTKTQWSGGAGADDDVLDGYGAEVTSGDNQNDMVKFSTRSIAIVNQVQYAVGRLDVTVQAATSSVLDNRALLPDFSADKAFYYTREENSSTVNCFPVTGILIGNQKAVDYAFHQNSGAEAYTIYDKTIPTGVKLTNDTPTPATTIHSLVFESADATAEDQPEAVTKFAVEFENNSGEWFAGKDGQIIYPGTKFYLVGTFDPWLNDEAKYVGTNNLIKKSFVQDYTTKAQLVINSLKNAYNTLPDLRAPQLELGLSVDLTWQQGITQTITIP